MYICVCGRQRATWHREAAATGHTCKGCKCGDPAFLQASKSAGTFRAYLHRSCGKHSAPELLIHDGPKTTETAEFYRRQCCRVPLPELKDVDRVVTEADDASAAAAASPADAPLKAKAEKLKAQATKMALEMHISVDDVRECRDCQMCGWDACMPRCPLEWDATKKATIKKYVPKLQSNGVSVQSELREEETTRKGLMERMQGAFAIADPHLFIDEWTSHHRHLVYASMGLNAIAIQTDFSAQYAHKAAWTNTCEHPPTSNMDVFVVTRVQFDATSKRQYITDVWRIFSAAKGSSGFHNQCLEQIVEYYRTILPLEITWVFTDGCRGQYKGKRNFRRISTFASDHSKASHIPMQCSSFTSSSLPSLDQLAQSVFAAATASASAVATESARDAVFTSASSSATPLTPCRTTHHAKPPPAVHDVIIRHLFACGHHFKGPHDGYGKDAKFMPKTAERHQRARIATTHDLYHFNAIHLPCPRRNVLASELIAALKPLAPADLSPLPSSELPADWGSVLNWANVTPGESCLPCVDTDPEPMEAMDIDPDPIVVSATATSTSPPVTTPTPLLDLDDLEMDDLNARVANTAHEEDRDSEPDDAGGDFDFEWDEVTGARLNRDEQLDDVGSAPSPSGPTAIVAAAATTTTATTATAHPPKAAKLPRSSRVVTFVCKAPGLEEQDGGETRVVTQRHKEPGIFSADKYFWLYYAVYPAVGVEIVPLGQVCLSPLEAHAILDPCDNVDADSVPNSNSTYELGGMSVDEPGLLFAKTLPCVCAACRLPSSIRCSPACPTGPPTRAFQMPCTALRHVPR